MDKDTKKTTNISRLGQRLKSIGEENKAMEGHLICPMAKKLMDLDDETAKVLYEVLNDKITPTTSIIREMRAAGMRVARQTIYDYRARVCCCAHQDKCGLDERLGN